MQTFSFSAELSRAVTRARYAVYGVAALLVGLSSPATGGLRSSWILPVTYLISAPVIVHLLVRVIIRLEQTATYREVSHPGRQLYPWLLMQWLFLAEWLVLVFILPRCGLSWTSGLCVGFVFLASNTALWGWRWGLWCLLGGTLLCLASIGGSPVPPDWTDIALAGRGDCRRNRSIHAHRMCGRS